MRKESVLPKLTLEGFDVFRTDNEGIEAWLANLPSEASARLESLSAATPLSHAQLNQLLTLSREAAMSPGFFRYYFGGTLSHPWDTKSVPHFEEAHLAEPLLLRSLEHLYWGMYRLYVDGLLYYGNVRSAYRDLRSKSFSEIEDFYKKKRLPTRFMQARGLALAMEEISSIDRYLIAEQACKAFESDAGTVEELADLLWREYRMGNSPGAELKIKQFLEEARLGEYLFALDEILNEEFPNSKAGLVRAIRPIFDRWKLARDAALRNSKMYLSMVNELDIYVATSMRSRSDFTKLADFCEKIFSDPSLSDLNIRYFDPTRSAANCHEDKGLIECLMVRCAKVLLYVAGDRDSYGKDAEAAMALSQGKPVIFFCEGETRRNFFNHIHPLSRLIEFNSGVAVGAMAVSTPAEVVELLSKLFRNQMSYRLEQKDNSGGFLLLKEELSKSVVRLQSNDHLLSSAFWNYYHGGSKFMDQEVDGDV